MNVLISVKRIARFLGLTLENLKFRFLNYQHNTVNSINYKGKIVNANILEIMQSSKTGPTQHVR